MAVIHLFALSLPFIKLYLTQTLLLLVHERVLVMVRNANPENGVINSLMRFLDNMIPHVFILLNRKSSNVSFPSTKICMSRLSLIPLSSVGACLRRWLVPSIGASNTEPVREVISDGYNGVLVDFFSHEDLSNAVIDLLSKPELSQTLGLAARQTDVDRYSLEKCLPSQLKLIDLVSSRSLPF